MLRQCAKSLLPSLVEFVAKMAPTVDDSSVSDQQLAAIGEVWKAFAALFVSVPEDQREHHYFLSASNHLNDCI